MLRLRRFAPAFALTLTSLGAGAATTDPALKTFLAKSVEMAAHSAVEPVAKLTRFPLRNRVYQEPERIGAAGFKAHFALNRFRELAPCLKSTPPRRTGSGDADLGEWEVDCDGNNFYFARAGANWRLSGFEIVNE